MNEKNHNCVTRYALILLKKYFLANMDDQEKESLLTVGQKLKKIRKERGFNNYRSLSLDIDIEPKHYWNLENDKTDWKISSLKKILEFYDIPPSEFFNGVKL